MKNTLLKERAVREVLNLFNDVLPDPDKILAENNYDYSIYRELLLDAHLSATIQQRKSQVLQMGWELNYDGPERIKNELVEIIQNMPLQEIGNNVLDAVLYGYAVGEVNWEMRGSKIIPVNIIYKPQEWFMFDIKNRLRLRVRARGNYLFEPGEELPPYKFILCQHMPSYTNPYGEKLLSRCFWPVTFKKAGIEFWELMVERFGSPNLIGRYAAGATESEKNQLLEDLEQMTKDIITVMRSDQVVEWKESPKYSVGGLYENLIQFLNTEISKAILTATLTIESGSVGNYKSAVVQQEMISYLGMQDKKLIEFSINKLLEYYLELNHSAKGGEKEKAKIKFNRKEGISEFSIDRDKILKEMGIEFSKEYFKKRYNLTETDFEIAKSTD
ncbi:MAG: DUF935 family protein [Melioribacteraceae bacterium]